MRKYGLIGYPITHSFSPGYFKRKFEEEAICDARYDLYPLKSISEFNRITDVQGLNVTIPYKEAVIPFLDELSDEARKIEAVNTISFRDGIKRGFNTDIYGFERSLIPLWNNVKPERALVLGSGGASKAVTFVLEKLGIQYKVVSRSKGDLRYEEMDDPIIARHRLIVNTTPLGMSPNIENCPEIHYDALTDHHILYDLIYNPYKTLFLKKGEDRGAIIKNGLEMLELQADRSWEIWNTP